MVGVPRSQGCRDCRRKKKGCDLQKPVCGQCARLGLECVWDDKRWTFVTQRPAMPSGSSKLPIRRRSDEENSDQSSSLLPRVQREERSLSRTVFETGSIGEFWDRYPPKDNFQSIGGVHAGYWIKTVQELATFDDTANLALQACALTAIGRMNSDGQLLRDGTRLYAKALRQTNNALQDPVRAQSDAILASCKLLSMNEGFRFDNAAGVSTQGHDWHKHVEGICRIIELRGPERHVAQHGHSLLEEARVSAMIAGMVLRKPNFLAERAWHTIPWETWPRNLRDEFCDIAISMPDVLLEHDALCQKLSALESGKEELFLVLTEAQNHINHCIFVAKSLREWEQRALDTCLEESTPERSDLSGEVTLLDVCKDHGYGFFHVAMQYWAVCIVLYSSTWIARGKIAKAAGIRQPTPLPALMKMPDVPTWMNPHTAASNITKCADHYLKDAAGLWGPLSATFSMGAALHFYAASGCQDSQEMKHLRGLFAQSKSGKLAGEFSRSIANTGHSKKGDPADVNQHVEMAKSWYGTDVPSR